MATEFTFTDQYLDVDDIRDSVSAELGRPVAVVVGWPVDDRAGVLIIEEDIADGPRIDLDQAVVERALLTARQKGRQRDQDAGPRVYRQLRDELVAAETDQARWAVLTKLLTQLAQREADEGKRTRDDRQEAKRLHKQIIARAERRKDRPFTEPRGRRKRPGVQFK